MNWKGFQKKRTESNPGGIPRFAWRDLKKTSKHSATLSRFYLEPFEYRTDNISAELACSVSFNESVISQQLNASCVEGNGMYIWREKTQGQT
jgi:hypothetical protein